MLPGASIRLVEEVARLGAQAGFVAGPWRSGEPGACANFEKWTKDLKPRHAQRRDRVSSLYDGS